MTDRTPNNGDPRPPRDPQRPGSGGTSSEPKKRSLWPLLLVVLLVVLGVFLLQGLFEGDVAELSIGELYRMLELPPEDNPLYELTRIGDQEFRGTLKPELAAQHGFVRESGKPVEHFRVTIASERLREDLEERILLVVGNNYKHERASLSLTQIVLSIAPWVLLILLLWFLFFRRLGPSMGQGGVFSFGKSRAKLHTKETVNVTFKDVAGIDEARDEITEVIEFLRNPEKFSRMGGRIPRGVMLIGPPGCGKTLLAKAVAGEANVPFFSISGSDFVEMFVGVGASRVRDMFKQAKDNSPCIVFLDEIDAVGRRRGTGLGGGHDEREQTLNAILVEMDGFETDAGIIIFAATNRPDVLDPALLRPGRFDRRIQIELPDVNGRRQIIRVHAKNVKLAPDFDPQALARGTPGFSGAEIANMVNEAAIVAVLTGKEAVDMECFEEARDKVLWGRPKKSRVMSMHELSVLAHHEAGHTLLQAILPNADPVHKVTIIPRGPAAGATMSLPEEDRYIYPRAFLDDKLCVLFGGRVAESIIIGEVTTGASDDIKRATELARHMVCEWGMSEELGPLNYSDSEEHMFLGREIARTTHRSEETAKIIDQEVRRIVDEAEERARRLIIENRGKVEQLAQALLQFETLMQDEIELVLIGGDVAEHRRKKKAAAAPEPKPSTPVPAEGGVLPQPKALLDGQEPTPSGSPA